MPLVMGFVVCFLVGAQIWRLFGQICKDAGRSSGHAYCLL